MLIYVALDYFDIVCLELDSQYLYLQFGTFGSVILLNPMISLPLMPKCRPLSLSTRIKRCSSVIANSKIFVAIGSINFTKAVKLLSDSAAANFRILAILKML